MQQASVMESTEEREARLLQSRIVEQALLLLLKPQNNHLLTGTNCTKLHLELATFPDLKNWITPTR